jgi:hypothetical protein
MNACLPMKENLVEQSTARIFTFHERKRREVGCQCLRCAPHLNMDESQRWRRRRRRTKSVQRHNETFRDGNRTSSGWPHQSPPFLRLTRSRFSSRALASFLRRHRAIWRERREAPSPLKYQRSRKKCLREGISPIAPVVPFFLGIIDIHPFVFM